MTARPATLLAGLLLAAPATAEQRDIFGTWVGTYACGQGRTALVLSTQPGKSAPLSARFHFGATPDNPSVPSGCFAMEGVYHQQSGSFLLIGDAWLHQPPDYITVDLKGRHLADSDASLGDVHGPGCRGFELRRLAAAAFDEAACRAGAPPLR